MNNEAKLKEALQRICGLHDQKGSFQSAIADAKVLLHELYPEHKPHFEYQWRVIDGFSKYEVSTKGEVRLAVKGFNRPKGHMMKGCVKPKGYTQYRLLNDDGKQKDLHAHRIVAQTYLGECPHNGWMVAHLDGNPRNNDVSNLKWVSNSENQLHCREHGKAVPHRALSMEQAKEVRSRFDNGERQSDLAREYKVSHGVINRIVNQVTYVEEFNYG